MREGEKAKSGKKKEFVERIREAEGRAVIGWLAKIEKAATDGNWQAAAWKLERRYPENYGRQRLELTGKDGDELVIKVVYEDKLDASND
jgi:hypothetical protein